MEVKEIIERIYRQYLVAREQLQQRCEACHKNDVADKIATCNLFKGTEDIEDLARLFTSPQGVEFCLAANFPNLATLRLFKRFDTAKYGIYIDAGNIALKNPGTAFLIGRTTATVECDTCTQHSVITMYGATATVLASGWAVVRTETGMSTNIIRRTSDHAIIL